MTDIRVAIDRGGTFCDVIAYVPGREPLIFKLLSEDPSNYRDAPTEAIRRVLATTEGRDITRTKKLDGTRIGKSSLLPHRMMYVRARLPTSVFLTSFMPDWHDSGHQCFA